MGKSCESLFPNRVDVVIKTFLGLKASPFSTSENSTQTISVILDHFQAVNKKLFQVDPILLHLRPWLSYLVDVDGIDGNDQMTSTRRIPESRRSNETISFQLDDSNDRPRF